MWLNILIVFVEEWLIIVEKVFDVVEDMIWEIDENVDFIFVYEGLDSVDDDFVSVNVEDCYMCFDEFLMNYVDFFGYDVVLFDFFGLINNVMLNGLFVMGCVIVLFMMGEFEE